MLKERQWSTSLKADVNSHKLKTEIIPLDCQHGGPGKNREKGVEARFDCVVEGMRVRKWRRQSTDRSSERF